MRTGFFRTSHDQRRRASVALQETSHLLNPPGRPRARSSSLVESLNGGPLLKIPERHLSSGASSSSQGVTTSLNASPRFRRRSNDGGRVCTLKRMNTKNMVLRPKTLVATAVTICAIVGFVLLIAVYIKQKITQLLQ